MLQNEAFCIAAEAQKEHGRKRNYVAHRKDDIQREHLAQKAVDHRRKSRAPHRGGADKAKDRASVFLGQRQHEGGVEHRIARAIDKSRQKRKNT